MWFVDVVIDLPWFTEKKGKLGKPKSRARQLIPGTNVENEFLLYGDEHAIRHLRVMLHTDADQPPHDIVNSNVHAGSTSWRSHAVSLLPARQPPRHPARIRRP
jgi:hypothetical protein